MCSLFKNPVTFHEDNKWVITLVVSPQMRPRTKRIAIKYHHFWSFSVNGDVEIQHIDTKEQIANFYESVRSQDFQVSMLQS